MDSRKVSVRCKAQVRLIAYSIQVVSHAVPVGFFVQSKDESDGSLRFKTAFFQGFHGIKTCDNGSFVICSSSAADITVYHLAAVRLEIPAAAFRNNVEMAYYAYYTVFCPCEVYMSAVIIGIEKVEALFFCFLHHEKVCLMDIFTEGHTALCIRDYARYGYKTRQR